MPLLFDDFARRWRDLVTKQRHQAIEPGTAHCGKESGVALRISNEIMNAVMDALAAHTTMSKQAIDSERVREGLKDVLLGPAQLTKLKRQGWRSHVKLWAIQQINSGFDEDRGPNLPQQHRSFGNFEASFKADMRWSP